MLRFLWAYLRPVSDLAEDGCPSMLRFLWRERHQNRICPRILRFLSARRLNHICNLLKIKYAFLLKKLHFFTSFESFMLSQHAPAPPGSNFYNGEKHLIDDELNVLFDGIKKKLGSNGCLFVAFDACYSEGLEMAKSMIEQGDVKKIGPIRGTADILKISRNSKVAKISLPQYFSKGAKMVVVSACRDNERNYEYLEPTTKRFYGSLSYCLKHLIESGLNLNKWERFFEEEKYRDLDIFMSKQHPTFKIYK